MLTDPHGTDSGVPGKPGFWRKSADEIESWILRNGGNLGRNVVLGGVVAPLAVGGAALVPASVWLAGGLLATTQIKSSDDAEGTVHAASIGAGGIVGRTTKPRLPPGEQNALKNMKSPPGNSPPPAPKTQQSAPPAQTTPPPASPAPSAPLPSKAPPAPPPRGPAPEPPPDTLIVGGVGGGKGKLEYPYGPEGAFPVSPRGPRDVTLNIDPKANPMEVGDIAKTKFDDGRFGAVHFEHVPFKAPGLDGFDLSSFAEVRRLLTPGGRLKITTGRATPADKVGKALESFGFKDIKIDHVDGGIKITARRGQ